MTAAGISRTREARSRWAYALLFGAQPLLGVGYQVCAENAARSLQVRVLGLQWFEELARTPWVWGAVAFDVAALASWVVVLSEFPLSFAFALTSIAYVLVIAASVLLFHETLQAAQVWGGAFILGGIALMIGGPDHGNRKGNRHEHDRE